MKSNSPKISYQEIYDSLPEYLQIEFEHIVQDYRYASELHFGRKFVSYAILGDLIKAGWRRTAEEIK